MNEKYSLKNKHTESKHFTRTKFYQKKKKKEKRKEGKKLIDFTVQ